MNILLRPALWLCMIAAPLTGCVSVLNVQKATNDTAGIRYYLPKVFIKVTPSADGTVVVEKLYMPDPTQEYVITAKSYLGNYTIDINRTDSGLLETVSFNSDSTGIAKQLISSEAAVRSADIDAKAAKAKTDTADAKTAADKAKTALDAADKARKDAKLALDIATGKLQLLDTLAAAPNATQGVKDQFVTARLSVIEAQAKYDAAQLAYNTLASDVASANGTDGANAAQPTAPTPAFYKVDMTPNSVVLREAFAQKDIETWKVPEAASAAEPLFVLPLTQVVRPAEKSKALTGTVKSNQLLLSARGDRFALGKGPKLPPPKVALQPDRTSILLEFPSDLANGDYDLDIIVESGKPAARVSNTVSLQIQIAK